MRLTAKKKKKHILTFFQSESKKFVFYFKNRSFDTARNLKNYYIRKKFTFGLISLESIYLQLKPLLACIKFMKYYLKLLLLEKGALFILIFPDFVLTSKPNEVRMGRGKGLILKKIVLLKKNTLMFKLTNVNFTYGFYILNQCRIKLPVKTKITFKNW